MQHLKLCHATPASDGTAPQPIGSTIENGEVPAVTGQRRPLEPLTYDTDDLAFVLRSSLATIHRLRAAGKLPRALKLGGQLRWRVDEVKAWCAAGMPDLKTWEAMRSNP
jgi:hypothetical protein